MQISTCLDLLTFKLMQLYSVELNKNIHSLNCFIWKFQNNTAYLVSK